MTKRKLFHGLSLQKFPSETVLQKQRFIIIMANGMDIYKNFINKARLRAEKKLNGILLRLFSVLENL